MAGELRYNYVASGTNKTFAYGHKIDFASDLAVYLGETLQTSGYTVTGVGSDTYGDVVFGTAPAAGTKVTILSAIPLTREHDYQQEGPFLADEVDADYDRLWMKLREHAEFNWRVVRLRQWDGNADLSLPIKADRANKLLGFDANGNVIVSTNTVDSAAVSAANAALSEQNAANSASVAAAQATISTTQASNAASKAAEAAASATQAANFASFGNFIRHEFTGDGTTTVFTLPGYPGTSNSLLVVVDGMTQKPESAYTVVNDVLTFSEAPPVGAVCWVIFMGREAQIPVFSLEDGTVDASAIVNTQTGKDEIVAKLGVPKSSELSTVATSGSYNDLTNKPSLGSLATKNAVDYNTDVTNKPTLGTMAAKNAVDYNIDVTNKPSLGSMAAKNSVDYNTDVTNKPTLGSMAAKSSVDYNTDVTNKPSIPSVLDDLADVATAGALAGQVLGYTAGGWAPTTVTGGGASAATYQAFTSNGTWTKPAGITMVFVRCVGGGGGGGSGRRGATSTDRAGGGGGAGGTMMERMIPASLLPETVTVTVGAGGLGGAGAATDGTNGSAGTSGGHTSFAGFLYANGGYNGAAGVTGVAVGGDVRYFGQNSSHILLFMGIGGNGNIGNGGAGYRSGLGPGGGGGGAGISSTNVVSTGGQGGQGYGYHKQAPTAGLGTGSGGTSIVNQPGGNGPTAGDGGGGGCPHSTTFAGNNGGNGAAPGGGGGGGSASLNGFVSGAGGNGGNGIVEVWAW